MILAHAGDTILDFRFWIGIALARHPIVRRSDRSCCNLRNCDRLYNFMIIVVTEYPVVAIAIAVI